MAAPVNAACIHDGFFYPISAIDLTMGSVLHMQIHQIGRHYGHSLKPQMIMMCVTSLVTASKECQTGAKSCKAGKMHNADKGALPDWRYKTIAASRDIDNESNSHRVRHAARGAMQKYAEVSRARCDRTVIVSNPPLIS
jgi:hypothetical protein